MLLRSEIALAGGVDTLYAVLADVAILCASFFIGLIYFRRYDILQKTRRNKMYIEMKSLSKTIKGAKVLDGISLKLEGGRVYGLKGKNGSGKTMLMRAMCGLIKPSSGSVLIDGRELGKEISFPPSIGVLIENPAFLTKYTGFKNLKILAGIQNKIDDEKSGKHFKR